MEIKCPYSIRENHPKDVTLQNQCFLNKLNNKWEVSKECPYFAQIQGQLGLYELDERDLVIYTKKGIHISTVRFDEEYFLSMIQKLLKFHRKYVMERIFQSVMCKTCDDDKINE